MDLTCQRRTRPTGYHRDQTLCGAPYRLILFVILLALAFSACRPEPQATAVSPTNTATRSPTPEEGSHPPVVEPVVATPTNPPAFVPLRREDLSVTPTPDQKDGDQDQSSPAVEQASPTSAATEPVTSTLTAGEFEPQPTFTPPALPVSSGDDHYWLRRPVAQDGVLWTDKHYPYGSTRGGQLRPHHGVEFNVPYNTEILAAAAGTVVVAGTDEETAYGPHTNFYGGLVVIEHQFQHAGQPLYTLYGHLNEVRVSAGQQVAVQEVIGLSGATGIADGPHMHFEVRLGANSYDQTRNPLLWLYPFPDRGTIAGRVVWPDGQPVPEAPVTLHRIDGSSPYYATTSYAGDTLNSDEVWNENFAIDDVVAGYYEVVVRAGDKKYTAETWVYPYTTSFVEITLQLE